MLNSRFQIRLPRRLLVSWKTHVADRLASNVIRTFMIKAIAAIRRNRRNLPRLVLGEYKFDFTKREGENE